MHRHRNLDIYNLKREKMISVLKLKGEQIFRNRNLIKYTMSTDWNTVCILFFSLISYIICIKHYIFIYIAQIIFSEKKNKNLDEPDGFKRYGRDLRKEKHYFPRKKNLVVEMLKFGGGSLQLFLSLIQWWAAMNLLAC